MRVIGLTGGIASGKSVVSRLLADRGAVVVDADALGHEIYTAGRPAWRELVEAFGRQIVGPDGQIDRGRLGRLVFADSAAMQRLRAIVWPLMKQEMRGRLGQLGHQGVRVVVLEAAVLVEAGWQDLVDEVWTVSVPPDVAVLRLAQRNGLSEVEARARLAAQIDNREREAHADVVIENTGSLEDLEVRVDARWQQFLQRVAGAGVAATDAQRV